MYIHYMWSLLTAMRVFVCVLFRWSIVGSRVVMQTIRGNWSMDFELFCRGRRRTPRDCLKSKGPRARPDGEEWNGG